MTVIDRVDTRLLWDWRPRQETIAMNFLSQFSCALLIARRSYAADRPRTWAWRNLGQVRRGTARLRSGRGRGNGDNPEGDQVGGTSEVSWQATDRFRTKNRCTQSAVD
jgi:hypothetical protein